GLLQSSEQSRFTARVLTESLQDFIATLVGWMRSQYQFEPAQVELPFGQDEAAPAWEIALAALPPDPKRQGTAALQDAGARGEAFGVRQSSGAFAGPPPPHPASSVQHQASSIQHPASAPRLALRGRIDRVDLFRNAAADEA